MKKTKKLTILFSIVTISILVAIGCSNDNSSDEPEATPAAAATEDTQTPAATTDTTTTTTDTTPSSNEPEETPVSGSEEDDEEPECTCASDCAAGQLCEAGVCVDYNSPGCGDYISNCITYSPNDCDVCTQCAAGFYLVDGHCRQPVCGNGIREADEGCDDGNGVNGDGCSSTCQVERPCDAGYYLDGNGRCKEIPIYACIDYESGECRSCRSGYSLVNGRCEEDRD